MIEDLIKRYKEFKIKKGHSEEFYKYIAVQHFQKNWKLDAVNFAEMLKSSISQQENLMYNLAVNGINSVAEKEPQKTKLLFIELFDESKDLQKRLSLFQKGVDELIKSIDSKLGGHQDERTCSVYLTFRYPEKYSFYKNSYYLKYCKFIGIKDKSPGQKYVHYLDLIKEFKEKYLKDDNELWQLTNATLPENAWKDLDLNILAQDVLYVTFDIEPEPNYWVFQGNPKFYDIIGSLREGALKTWSVAAHKDKIQKGDKVILWVTGDNSGCYALCRVISDITIREDDPKEMTFYIDKNENIKSERVEIEIEQNLFDKPILKEQLTTFVEFANFKGGNQGTNFTATKEQYERIISIIQNQKSMKKYWIYSPGENAIMWNEFYDKGIMGLGWDKLGDLNNYKTKKDITIELQKLEETLSSKKNDATANYEFKNAISIGDTIIAKKGIGELIGYGVVTSDYFYDSIREHYRKCRKVEWKKNGSWKTSFNLPLKTLTDITSYPSEHPDFKYYHERLMAIMENGGESYINPKRINIPQNLILYGPPGTGKTYQLINNYIKYFTENADGKSKEICTYELVSELKWWEVITLSLYEKENAKVNELIQHPLLAEKINQSENSKPRNTVWFWLQNHTKQDCVNVNVAKRSDPQIFWKDENSVWSIDKKLTEEMLPDLVEKLEKWKNFKPENKVTKRYEMITFHQSYSYEEFIEGIRPGFDEEEELRYKIEPGIFLRIADKARKDYQNNYAIFIDEINRGNISKIFGELITLIESDKRQGGENELEVILPYSKSKFSVPSNLYIIGTMNTADRSIALIDTALRRRFCFKEMMPDSSLLNDDVQGINLQLLLSKINERIEFLLDRDHTIGHSFFMKASSRNEICTIFKNKIIPLLQEYFYNDWEKVQLVLGDNKSWGKTEEQKLVRVKKHYDLSAEKELFGSDIEDFEDEIIYEINPALEGESFDEIPAESFIHIYQKPGKANF